MPIYLPKRCLRSLECCQPLAQIESDDGVSFICVGENDGSDREVDHDTYTYCWKNREVDQRDHVDCRDLVDTVSVLAQALSVIANEKESR